jgi:glycerophosphoryl diester phosphodiesterase
MCSREYQASKAARLIGDGGADDEIGAALVPQLLLAGIVACSRHVVMVITCTSPQESLMPFSRSVLAAAFSLLATTLPPGANPPAHHDAQIGPRPFYLVDKMKDGPLKQKLSHARAVPQSEFSIGHRGAAMQFPEHSGRYQAAARGRHHRCDVTFTKDGSWSAAFAMRPAHRPTFCRCRRCRQNAQPFGGRSASGKKASASAAPATSRSRIQGMTRRWMVLIRCEDGGRIPNGTPRWLTDPMPIRAR